MRKTLSILLIISSIFYTFGCAPNNIPTSIIPPTPKQTESALPNVKKTSKDVDKSLEVDVKIGAEIDSNKVTITEQKLSIIESLSQAEKIKEKTLSNIAVTELDAINLINELKKVQSRNLFLEQQNVELFGLRESQTKILKVIKETLSKTEDQIILKDEEARQLREQHAYISNNLIAKNNESENLKKLLTKEKETSASAKVYKNWVIGLVCVFILWVVVKKYTHVIFSNK